MQPHKSFITKFGELIDQHHAEQHSSTEVPVQPSRASRLIRWLLPNGGTLILIALLIATQSVWARGLQSPTAPGPSATTVNYQGRLADSGGTPINGSRAMTFAIYDAATSGNLIWGPETHAAIPVSSGLFSVGLGSQTSGGIPTMTWNGDRYLEIQVGGETLSPRELIRSVPIAGMALTVPDGVIGSTQIADGSVKSRDVQLTAGSVAAVIPTVSLPLQSTLQDVPGTSFTLSPDTAQKYLIYVTADLEAYNGLAVVKLYVDDVDQSSSIILSASGTSSERGTVSQSYLVDLTPGAHSVVLKARLYSGTSAVIFTQHTKITYLAISQ